MNLNTSPIGKLLRIGRVDVPNEHPEKAGNIGKTEISEIAVHLQQLGFLPGEQIVVQRRARPGNDPIVVRVGTSTFALRKLEASCVVVE